MATQNIAAVPNKTYIQIHFRNVQSLCNIDNGNLSVKRTILANPTMDIPDHTYSLIRILDDRVITEPEEHEDKEIHSEEDIVYHDKYPFNKYEMEKELYSECMDVLHKLEFTITLLKRENLTEIHRKILPSLLLFKKQQIVHLPSPFNARNYLAFVTPERDILLIDIPVSGLQLLQQFAFGHFAVTFQTVCPHIIAQNSGDQ